MLRVMGNSSKEILLLTEATLTTTFLTYF